MSVNAWAEDDEKKNTKKRNWDPKNMASALEAVIDDCMTFREAGVKFQVPETTLRRRYREQYFMAFPKDHPSSLGGQRQTFSVQMTETLKALLYEMDDLSLGLSRAECRRLIYDFADKERISHQFSRKKRMTSSKWLKEFMWKNDLTLGRRPPRDPAVGVRRFFQVLGDIRKEKDLKGGQIYNLLEMSFSVAPTEDVVPDGRCCIATILSCGCGTGELIPPFMIFPRKSVTPAMIDGAPAGTMAVADMSGTLNLTTFIFFLTAFAECVKPTKEAPVVLLVAKRSCLTSYWAFKYAKDHNITLMGFPRNVPYKIKPLSVSFLGALKVHFLQALESFHVSRVPSLVSEKDLATLYAYAFMCAARSNSVTSGFETSGIEPFNPEIGTNITSQE